MQNNAKTVSAHPVIKYIHAIEDALLVVILLAMIILATFQVGIRNLFDVSILWIDPVLRISVLWIGLIGAMIASRNNEHISIDIAQLYLSKKNRQIVAVFNSFFTCVISVMVCWYSSHFVCDEYIYETVVFGNVPSWYFQIIIPVAFLVIAVRYATLFIFTLLSILPINRYKEASL
ncbi:C4-dicarboxylate ABC transporter permease [Vibrio sp. MACH09]|uniref:TRAP transporter small permease n=1 Tax=unclassified Vibrio TaxID=2614977 RepID=UPI001493999B|nr:MULTISPECIES: TRAP transporter small permease [unclassified Vibrio]NOI67797.1 TRAP transporter small permease [Vibrio sp. 99-8-1]GLO60304.1 C4-dicarboxylate ABC transporter permease [Vibrio sp. MACH09]